MHEFAHIIYVFAGFVFARSKYIQASEATWLYYRNISEMQSEILYFPPHQIRFDFKPFFHRLKTKLFVIILIILIMNLVGIVFIVFGIIIIAAPELIAWLIGIFLILIGANMLTLGLLFKKGDRQSIRFGKYEIFRK